MTTSDQPMIYQRVTPPGVRLVLRRWWVLLVTSLLGCTAAIVHYKTAPRWYEASILIVPKESALGMAASRFADLPVDIGIGGSLSYSDSERIAAILQSRSISDEVIAKFDLIARYEVDKIEKARKLLWSLCATTVEKKPNLVRLTCEDKDPITVRDMAEYFGQVGDAGFRRIASSSASEQRKFLTLRTQEARRELEEASDAVRRFQEEHKIIDLPEQGKAVVSAMAGLEADLIAKRIQLSYMRGFASDDESQAAQLRQQMDIVRRELRVLEDARRTAGPEPGAGGAQPGPRAQPSGTASGLFPPAMALPGLRADLERLLREQKVREAVFLMLTERHEALKVEEAQDLASFVVFDHAAEPTHRIRPRLRIVPIGFAAGLVLGLLIIIIPAWWRDLGRRAALERA
jgi:tyrosine-protein kinase Etk/Wzc